MLHGSVGLSAVAPFSLPTVTDCQHRDGWKKNYKLLPQHVCVMCKVCVTAHQQIKKKTSRCQVALYLLGTVLRSTSLRVKLASLRDRVKFKKRVRGSLFPLQRGQTNISRANHTRHGQDGESWLSRTKNDHALCPPHRTNANIVCAQPPGSQVRSPYFRPPSTFKANAKWVPKRTGC